MPLPIVCCYFNPQGFVARRRNYREMRERLSPAVDLLTVELTFGDAEPELADLEDVLHLRCPDVMWQKERLLQIGIDRLLDQGAEQVAWIDADTVFESPDWHASVLAQLQDHEVVHCMTEGRKLFTDRTVDTLSVVAADHRGLALRTQQMTFGGAWAARREFFASHALYDRGILGGGDTAFAQACLPEDSNARQWASWSIVPRLHEHYGAYRDRFAPIAVGHVPGRCTFLAHGAYSDRGFSARYRALAGYDPVADVAVASSGCLEWSTAKPELHAGVRGYFESRAEDRGIGT